jgi:iron(III) transport system permease protein
VPTVVLILGTFMKAWGFFDVPGGAFTLRNWTAVFHDPSFLRATKNTLYLALGGASLSVAFITLLAYVLVRTRYRLRATMDLLTWVPAALPGIIIAVAWLWIFLRTPFFRPLYGTMAALILVSGMGGITLGVQIIKANLLQIGNDMEEASYVAGSGLWTTLRRVVIPLLAPTLVVVWVLHFITAASSAIMPALLASSASKPLALLQLDHVLDNRPEAASVAGVVVVLLTVGVAILARRFGFRVGLGRT